MTMSLERPAWTVGWGVYGLVIGVRQVNLVEG